MCVDADVVSVLDQGDAVWNGGEVGEVEVEQDGEADCRNPVLTFRAAEWCLESSPLIGDHEGSC